ncbi:NAD-dependent epimerase/dehydratase family protein [Leptothoe spongobia]|uniref:NAD(P)-dependent oxidoreductase n=1 Tax=Leptothoe spongobia TAU-MAC 1115 TaxID=1967444 RepID=A0A947GRP6_9CYAN|nr:NAD(P)-dependent oxidoreductase [Leptothoe spongobia]MBT9317576.1 NAD(P)-dependent oxidoreductase [Leptothoe spongobia TAU-MAC 1115]
MKVLITGASGRFARFVIRELADRYEVVLTSRHSPPKEFAHLHWLQADLTCFGDCQRVMQGIDAIQHVGAQSEPTDHPEMRTDFTTQGIPFDTTFKTNLLGTYYLMQAAVEVGVKTVVMTGSNCALGHGFRISSTPFPIQSLPIDEQHPCYPEDSYSFTKHAGESLLASYTRAYGIRTYVTRPAGIRTEIQRHEMANTAKPAKAWDPWFWGWVGSEDLAHAQRLLMEAASELPEHDVYFVNADDTHALEPSQTLIKRFKPEWLPLVNPLENHQAFIRCDKIKRQVGWAPTTDWRQYLLDF